MKYRVDLLDKAPNMTKSTVAWVEGTYQDAVNKAHQVFQKTRHENSTRQGNKTYSRAVSVHVGQEVFTWHFISMSGEVTDRNFNSGVTYPTY